MRDTRQTSRRRMARGQHVHPQPRAVDGGPKSHQQHDGTNPHAGALPLVPPSPSPTPADVAPADLKAAIGSPPFAPAQPVAPAPVFPPAILDGAGAHVTPHAGSGSGPASTRVQRPSHGPPSYAAVLRNRAFMSLWGAQVLSQLAQNLTWISLGAYVASQNVHGKSTLVSIIIASAMLAQFLLSPFAGVFVDRVSKRAVLVGSNALRVGLSLLFIITLPLPVGTQTTAIILLVFVANAVAQFFAPAEAVTIPLLVEKRNLIVASSLFNLTYNACQVIPVIFGLLLLTVIGILPLLLLVAGLYVGAALLVATLPAVTAVKHTGPVAQSMGEAGRHLVADLREALHFLARDPGLRLTIFQINVAPSILFVFGTLGLAFVHDTFGLRENQAWILLLPAGAGLVAGALLVGRIAAGRRKEDVINAGLLGMGGAIAVLGAVAAVVALLGNAAGHIGGFITQNIHALPQARNTGLVPPAMLIAAVLGFSMALSTIPAQTLVFERTEEKVRGRVLAMQQLIGGAIPIIPLLTLAPLADIYGTAAIMTVLGIIVLLVGLLSIRIDHGHRRLARHGRRLH